MEVDGDIDGVRCDVGTNRFSGGAGEGTLDPAQVEAGKPTSDVTIGGTPTAVKASSCGRETLSGSPQDEISHISATLGA